MKKLVSLLLVLALGLTAVAAFAEDVQTGVYTIFNSTGEKVTELYIITNETEETSENYALDPADATIDGIAPDEIIIIDHSIPASIEGHGALTLTFTTESGYTASFETLSIEEAPITLLAADAMTGATPISFTAVQQTGAYTIYNKTGEKVTELYLMVNATEELGDNLAGEEGLAADASIDVTKSISAAEEGHGALTLSFKTESGYEAAFETLSIEEAPITLLAADAMTGATAISFTKPE